MTSPPGTADPFTTPVNAQNAIPLAKATRAKRNFKIGDPFHTCQTAAWSRCIPANPDHNPEK
jgi:hypothetical protein